MTKGKFTLSSLFSGWIHWFANHTSIYGISESNVSERLHFVGEISNKLPNDLLGTNVCNSQLNIVDNQWWQCYNGPILLW